MEYPINEEDALEKIHQGRQIQSMINTEGYQKVWKPFVEMLLNQADEVCHDMKTREDHGKYGIVQYNTIKKILSICDDSVENMKTAIQYCNDNEIAIL